MAETNYIKTFLSNPISYVSGMIALGAVVFAWGVSSANKTTNVSDLSKGQTEMESSITELQESITIVRTDQKTILTILPTIIYNQNVLKEDFLKHIAHDSTALKIIELSNEFKGISEQLKKKYQLDRMPIQQNINQLSSMKN
jgi:hypothetical protein